ncbi:MAG: GNAT family N-acetyltransferase [Candidatus Eisenbacteria bacterium]|nr:GNAT family N-acetyltransferase [Candidatus Eisenbacteria bacterium]
MKPYPKSIDLQDGAEVVLRPMQEDDLDRSHRFFLHLPEEDRLHLRMDVTDREQVAIRMEPSDAMDNWRLVALHDDAIIGDGTLAQPRYGWRRHTAELRVIIARERQGLGLGTIMLSELFHEATRRGVEKLFGMVSAKQQVAIRTVSKLGFQDELVLRDHRRTLLGDLEDVVVMTVSIADAWRRMEDLMHAMDGQGRERY